MAEVKEHPSTEAPLYERDYALWVEQQARLLEAGRFAELDLPNLIDEVEELSRSQKRAIRNNLNVLLLHLLKWQFQPDKRSGSWRDSIREHRSRVADECEDSPSLRRYPRDIFTKMYGRARQRVADQIGLALEVFPKAPPFSVEQALDPDFLPE